MQQQRKKGETQISEKSRSFLVSFSGMDGSGKSTQIELMCKALTEAGFSLSQFAFWDHVVAFPKWRAKFSHTFLKSEGGVGAPGKPVQRNDKNNRAWYLILARYPLFLLDALRLRWTVNRALTNSAQVVVFDRYIYDQLATLPLGSLLARGYARLVLSFVPKPDVAYVLDAEPEVARQRKPEYPLGFLRVYRQSYLHLQEMAGLDLIPPQPLEMAHSEIMNKCARRIAIVREAQQLAIPAMLPPDGTSDSAA